MLGSPITISIRNATSTMETDPNTLRYFREYLSYEVQGAAFAKTPYWDGRIRLMKKDGTFPTGLLKFVINHLDKQGTKYTLKDERYVPTPSLSLKLTFPEWWETRPYQPAAVETTESNPRGVFVMGTGAGKSGTSAMLIASKNVPTLVVTPDTGLRTQLSDDYKQWFGERNVGTSVEENKPIIVANIQSLTKKPKELFKRFEMLVMDEFHHASATSYQDLNMNCANAYYRYGFTGTFIRPDGSDLEMFGVLSNVLFTKSTSDLIEEGYLVRPYITMALYELKDDRGKKLRLAYKDAYNYATQHIGLNTLIADWVNAKISSGKQTIVLVRLKEHGELLARMIPEGIFLHGGHKAEYREKIKAAFNERKVKCMIATSIFGEGQNIPSIDCFANARFQKTEIQTMQGIGRALRKLEGKDKAEVLDIFITGQKNLENHSIERLNSYRKEKAFRIKVQRA